MADGKPDNSVGYVDTQVLRIVEADAPLSLSSGKTLGPIDVAYETYGTLNEQRDNVILICHALSGNAHVAGWNGPDEKKPGWWDNMVGPGKGIDTDLYYVICSNILGGCSGTTGPSQTNPETNKPYGMDFPIITIADMVKVQKRLLETLGIERLLAVVGGSMGGMQVLQWAIDYPESVDAALVIASTTRLSPQAIAFDTVGRHSILADPCYQRGQYHDSASPDAGLAIARMIGHITYLSEESMRAKFGRKLRDTPDYRYDFDSEFSVETYLAYQGQTFVERFDANSYLYITKAMDYFDLERDHGSLHEAFAKTKCRFLIASFSSDWLFPPSQSEEMVYAVGSGGRGVCYCNITSPYGHDAFLLEPETLGRLIRGFVDATHRSIRGEGPDPAKRSLCDCSQSLDHTRPRVDYELIESLIEPQATVLDVGAGDGELLLRLIADKAIRAEGIELDEKLVVCCIERGLSVIHRDVQRGLGWYADDSFDYVLLSQTMQTVPDPEKVLAELLRIGKRVIVSFPNFAHWRCRLQLMLRGRAPVSETLPFEWYNSPNIHFLSLKDFDHFCEQLGAQIEKKIPLHERTMRPVRFAPNFFAEQAVYVLRKNQKASSLSLV